MIYQDAISGIECGEAAKDDACCCYQPDCGECVAREEQAMREREALDAELEQAVDIMRRLHDAGASNLEVWAAFRAVRSAQRPSRARR